MARRRAALSDSYVRRVQACIPVQREANKVWADRMDKCLARGDGSRRASKRCLVEAYRAYRSRIGRKCLPLLKDEKS